MAAGALTFSSAGGEVGDSIPVRLSKVATISWTTTMFANQISKQTPTDPASGSHLSNCLIESSLLSREQSTAVEGSALHLNSKEIQNPTSFKPVCIVSVHCQEHTRAFSRAEGCQIPTRRKSYGSRGTYFSMQLQVELENLLRTGLANDEVKARPNILPLGRTHIKSCGLQY